MRFGDINHPFSSEKNRITFSFILFFLDYYLCFVGKLHEEKLWTISNNFEKFKYLKNDSKTNTYLKKKIWVIQNLGKKYRNWKNKAGER